MVRVAVVAGVLLKVGVKLSVVGTARLSSDEKFVTKILDLYKFT